LRRSSTERSRCATATRPPLLQASQVRRWTSGGIDKLEAYRRLRVGEVWFWKNDLISVHVLERDGYESRDRSVCLQDLDLELVCRLAQVEPTSAAIRQLVATLRR